MIIFLQNAYPNNGTHLVWKESDGGTRASSSASGNNQMMLIDADRTNVQLTRAILPNQYTTSRDSQSFVSSELTIEDSVWNQDVKNLMLEEFLPMMVFEMMNTQWGM